MISPPRQELVGAPRLLLVEDEAELAEMLRGLLTEEGYAVDVATNGQAGLHRGLVDRYDVVVLDRRLPALDGLDLLGRWRRSGVTAPVLLPPRWATRPNGSRGSTPAPRTTSPSPSTSTSCSPGYGPCSVATSTTRGAAAARGPTRRGRPRGARRGDPVGLSERECELLATLAARPQQVFGRDDLLALVFPDASNPVAVDTYVHYLRRKLGRGVIETIRGRGYRIGRCPP